MATETPDRDLLEDLETLRDRIRVKLHLGSMELKDRWEDLEPKWQEVEAKADKFGDAADKAAIDIGKAARELGKRLRQRYEELLDELDRE